jgi:hypothetical protein
MSAPLRGQEPKHRPPSLGLLSKYPRNVISLLGAQFAVRELVAKQDGAVSAALRCTVIGNATVKGSYHDAPAGQKT